MKSICVLLAVATGIALAQPAAPPKPDQIPPATPAAKPPSAGAAPAAAAAPVVSKPAASAPIPGSAAELMRAGIQKQRDAVRQQAQSAGAWLLPWSDEPARDWPEEETAVSAPCDPIADAVAAPLIDSAARANQLQAQLLYAVIEQESGFRPCAVSSKGAQGLMQLMPDTAGSLGVKDTFDPQQNIQAGARYLKQLVDKYKGDLKLSLAAFNAGPAAVDAAGAVPDIPETRDYVDAILKKIK